VLSSQLHLALLLHELGSGDLTYGAAELSVQLLGGVNVTTYRTYKLFHNFFLQIFYFSFLIFLDTIFTFSGKAQVANLHLTAGAVFHGSTQGRRGFYLGQVQDLSAFTADKVDMGLYVSVEPLDSLYST
jgi:hypothetical protein